MGKREPVIRRKLLNWFSRYKRALPWRGTGDPYHVWLSEIIMQQTRVAQGTPYFERFIQTWPTVDALAKASEQEVLKLWQGLGYYTRARNLHHTAKVVAEKHKGRFPDSYEELIKLKGVGDYTAAAILSIAFGKPYAALDGNVYRVLSRLYSDALPVNAPSAKKHYQALADELLDRKRPGAFNEAMMEFGATICIPKNPLCPACPLRDECMAYQEGRVNEFPKKEAARPTRHRWFHYYIITTPKGIYLSKRKPGDIWEGLYDLPLIEKEDDSPLQPRELKALGISSKPKRISEVRHILSHQELHIGFYAVKLLKQDKALSGKYLFVKFSELEKYPLPKPVERALGSFEL